MKKIPPTRKLDANMVAKAIAMAEKGAPPRIIALALGFTTSQFKQWQLIGQEEDAWEEEHGNSRTLEEPRWRAMDMYRGIVAAEARFAAKVLGRMSKAMMKGDMWSVRWWLEKRVAEFSDKPAAALPSSQVKTVFYCPDNGRMPKTG